MENGLQFKTVYINYFKRIESFAFKYLRDAEKAKDLAQDVFLTFWENREKFCGGVERDVLPLLYVITKYKCLSYLRAEMRYNKYEGVQQHFFHTRQTIAIAALESPTFERLLSYEVSSLISKATEEMTDKVRETYILSKEKNLKYSEIAVQQNISVKAVEYRVSEALKVLRKYLKDYLKPAALSFIIKMLLHG